MARLFTKPGAVRRHTLFYDVRDALGKEGCPVCRLSLDSIAHSLDSLAYEQVNDPGLREQLRASRGFCPHHAWQFVHQPSSGLGVAIIYRDVLGEVARILEEGSAGGLLAGYRRKPALAWRLLPQASCPTCANLADGEGRYLSTLVDHLAEPDFADSYLAHDGLCLPHLERALGFRPDHQVAGVLLLTAINSLRSALESSSSASADGGSALTRLLVGSRGALTRRDPLIVPAGTDNGDTRTAEELLSDTEGEECPVCIRAREVDNRAVRLLAEERYEPHPWLCNLHAWQLSHREGGVAGGTLRDLEARDALRRLTTAVSGVNGEGATSGNGVEVSGGAWSETHPCAVESQRVDVEMGWARVLGRSMRSPAIQAAFRHSPGLCLPHLAQALRCADPSDARILARLEAERIAVVVGELDEYIRKQDYRFREEPWGQEVTAPRRAVELIVGVEGLRGVGGPWWPNRKR